MIKRVHHVSLVVRDIEEALGFYRDVLGLPLHKVADLDDQGVKAAVLELGNCELELVEPNIPDSGVARFLKSRGEGFHHLCLETDDVKGELARLEAKGVRLIEREPRAGLAGRIGFLQPSALHGVLVELAESAE